MTVRTYRSPKQNVDGYSANVVQQDDFDAVAARLADLRPVWLLHKKDHRRPELYIRGDRLTKNYMSHARQSRTKKWFRITSTRPFYPIFTDGHELLFALQILDHATGERIRER